MQGLFSVSANGGMWSFRLREKIRSGEPRAKKQEQDGGGGISVESHSHYALTYWPLVSISQESKIKKEE